MTISHIARPLPGRSSSVSQQRVSRRAGPGWLLGGLVAAGVVTAVPVAAYAQAAAPGPGARSTVVSNADSEFAKMDVNHDGSVTKEEFEGFVRGQQLALAQARNRAIFAALDTNHDGMLSRDEFARLAGNLPQPNVQPLIARLDTNHDGKLSRDEFRAGALANFDKVDTNHDGVISPDEMRAAAAARGSGQR